MTTPYAMTQEDAAAFIGVSKDTIAKERRSGRLRSVYIDSQPRIRTADLIAWVDGAPAEPPGLNA